MHPVSHSSCCNVQQVLSPAAMNNRTILVNTPSRPRAGLFICSHRNGLQGYALASRVYNIFKARHAWPSTMWSALVGRESYQPARPVLKWSTVNTPTHGSHATSQTPDGGHWAGFSCRADSTSLCFARYRLNPLAERINLALLTSFWEVGLPCMVQRWCCGGHCGVAWEVFFFVLSAWL